MKTPEEIKKELVEAIEEASWAVEGGDAHDLIDAVEKAHASMADTLAYIRELEITHRTEYCDEADYDCIALGNARKRIAELEAQMPKWISVQEALPKNLDNVLICDDRCGIVVGHYDEDDGHFWKRVNDNTFHSVDATHWMKLHEPPKEVQQNA